MSEDQLNHSINKLMNYDNYTEEFSISDEDRGLVKLLIENAECYKDGRLVLPCLWNKEVEHKLPNNYKLASNILKSNLKKLNKDSSKLEQYNKVFTEQLEAGIIEKVPLERLINNNNVSFMGHMAVFREHVESTKCRVVFMSNICEKMKNGSLSHNQVSLPGPNLNQKLEVAITLLRFNKFILVFDLVKAFHQIWLPYLDTLKLNFLWIKDIHNDFSEVAYKMNRLPFGMRFSPGILMVALYIILILHCFTDPYENDIRRMIYNLAYMDNLAYSCNLKSDLISSFYRVQNIFNPYGFSLQQFATNLPELQDHLENGAEEVPETKLLGILWLKNKDLLTNKMVKLDTEANTLRSVLSSINSCFDPLALTLPCRNRAKLFLHRLQMDSSISWDSPLGEEHLREWRRICKAYNSNPQPSIPRCIGDYSSVYNLIVFTDASKDLYTGV